MNSSTSKPEPGNTNWADYIDSLSQSKHKEAPPRNRRRDDPVAEVHKLPENREQQPAAT